MIDKIKINAFKSLYDIEFELGKVNCLIGANGTGKSNILEAIGVIGAAANGTVDDESLLRRGVRPGLPSLYKTSFNSEKTPVHIGLNACGKNGEIFRISLLNPLKNPEPAWTFKTEYLYDGKEDIVSDGVRNKTNLNPTKGLAALKLVDLAPESSAAVFMKYLQNYSIYSPNTPTLRGMIVDPQSRVPLGLAGGQLAEGFAELKKQMVNNSDLFDEILELVDWVDEIDTTGQGGALLSPSVARSKIVVKFTDRYMHSKRNTLTAYDASEGALYILFTAILCLSEKSPKFLAIDNIDQALNPRLVTRLAERMCRWIKKDPERQIIFTSHNPAILDGLDITDPDVRLFAVQRTNKGHTYIERIKLDDSLNERLKEYPLSRLWPMGYLGAVPNV
jgi:predicted ATPase